MITDNTKPKYMILKNHQAPKYFHIFLLNEKDLYDTSKNQSLRIHNLCLQILKTSRGLLQINIFYSSTIQSIIYSGRIK